MNAAMKIGSDYHPREEFLNTLFHALGVVFGIAILVMLLVKAVASNVNFTGFQITGLVLYGISLILMFLSSALYHGLSNTSAKFILKRLDHCAIFALIAGTYTPILLIGVNNHKSWVLFWIIWSIALIGIVFKVFPLCLKLLSVHKCHHFVKILTCILLLLSVLLSLPQLLRLSEKRPVHSH